MRRPPGHSNRRRTCSANKLISVMTPGFLMSYQQNAGLGFELAQAQQMINNSPQQAQHQTVQDAGQQRMHPAKTASALKAFTCRAGEAVLPDQPPHVAHPVVTTGLNESPEGRERVVCGRATGHHQAGMGLTSETGNSQVGATQATACMCCPTCALPALAHKHRPKSPSVPASRLPCRSTHLPCSSTHAQR